MNSAGVATPSLPAGVDGTWSRARWAGVVCIIFLAQLAFIFTLGTRQPIRPRPPQTMPAISLTVGKMFPLAALNDPTLFSLPHTHGFSGRAWELTPRPHFAAADWAEPLQWLPLKPETLGEFFRPMAAANPVNTLTLAEKTEPRIPPLETLPPAALPVRTSLRLEGGLASRELLNPPTLPSWPAADVLDDTVVLVTVNAAGRVISAAIQTGCGASGADQRALEIAQATRFAPVREGSMTWGRMIFDWHTVSPTAP